MMFFTGFTRFSSDIQKANATSSPKDKQAMQKRMYELVDEAEMIATMGNAESKPERWAESCSEPAEADS